MRFWRLAANDLSSLRGNLDSGAWRSTVSRDLQGLQEGDRLIFFCTSSKDAGYLGTGTVTHGLAKAGRKGEAFQVAFSVDTVLATPLKQQPVRKTLHAARLRIRYLPLYVLQLSSGEFQVMSRLIVKESLRQGASGT